MLELRRNSDQNPLSKVGRGAKQYFEDLSRDFSIMLSSEHPKRIGVALSGCNTAAHGSSRRARNARKHLLQCMSLDAAHRVT